MNRCILLLSMLFYCMPGKAQTAADYAVRLNATVRNAPPQIKLSWSPLPGATTYKVYRKAMEVRSWGAVVATITAPDTTYTDNQVVADSAYEYRVIKEGGSNLAYGYIHAGIATPPIHQRGILLLLVDSFFTDSCSQEVQQLAADISGDGWQLVRRDIARTLPDTSVRALIRQVDQGYGGKLEAVLLLGHIAVPYSGEINPDGHGDHQGAWPADVYYATRTGNWTDVTVNNSTASQVRNRNIPGDGKWDQSRLPAPAEFQVSRIDFHDMPAFHRTEVALMKNYLNRAHLYKTDMLPIEHRALIDDNFGGFGGEAFAANGWRNFSPLVGREKISPIDFISSLNDSSFQWALGCGGGSYTTAGGIGSTNDFAANQVNGIFTLLFGSYFGDWDVQNNFLRAPLCSETPALTSAWAGRPNWYMHHMALGQPIGYATRISQNNALSGFYDTYLISNSAASVHIALMGDLTLRTDYIRPPGRIAITTTPTAGATISWSPSPDTAVNGYYVYRSDSLFGRYELLSGMLADTIFKDSVGVSGLKYYMVRPVKETLTPSGTYDNLGIGIRDSATVTFPDPPAGISLVSNGDVTIYPNPVTDQLQIVFTDAIAGEVKCHIFDMTGRLTASHYISLNQGNYAISLPVSQLTPGIYTLHILSENQVTTRKFIKLQ